MHILERSGRCRFGRARIPAALDAKTPARVLRFAWLWQVASGFSRDCLKLLAEGHANLLARTKRGQRPLDLMDAASDDFTWLADLTAAAEAESGGASAFPTAPLQVSN